MLKVNNKGTRMRKVNDKVNTSNVVLVSLLSNYKHIRLLVIVFLLLTLISQLPTGIVACCFDALPAGNNLGKVSTYGETK